MGSSPEQLFGRSCEPPGSPDMCLGEHPRERELGVGQEREWDILLALAEESQRPLKEDRRATSVSRGRVDLSELEGRLRGLDPEAQALLEKPQVLLAAPPGVSKPPQAAQETAFREEHARQLEEIVCFLNERDRFA